jgi:hypothetical protein
MQESCRPVVTLEDDDGIPVGSLQDLLEFGFECLIEELDLADIPLHIVIPLATAISSEREDGLLRDVLASRSENERGMGGKDVRENEVGPRTGRDIRKAPQGEQDPRPVHVVLVADQPWCPLPDHVDQVVKCGCAAWLSGRTWSNPFRLPPA